MQLYYLEGGREAGALLLLLPLQLASTVAGTVFFVVVFFCILVTSQQLHRLPGSREAAVEMEASPVFQCPVTCLMGAKKHWQQRQREVTCPKIAAVCFQWIAPVAVSQFLSFLTLVEAVASLEASLETLSFSPSNYCTSSQFSGITFLTASNNQMGSVSCSWTRELCLDNSLAVITCMWKQREANQLGTS